MDQTYMKQKTSVAACSFYGTAYDSVYVCQFFV